jgi:hypothetical protein
MEQQHRIGGGAAIRFIDGAVERESIGRDRDQFGPHACSVVLSMLKRQAVDTSCSFGVSAVRGWLQCRVRSISYLMPSTSAATNSSAMMAIVSRSKIGAFRIK